MIRGRKLPTHGPKALMIPQPGMTGIGNPPITLRRSPWLCWKISAETVLLYMTFEEFFQKKKIDLTTLGAERPALLDEFKKHFEAMGEKSFDHTKKYWFNKLRRAYPLKAG